MAKTGQQ